MSDLNGTGRLLNRGMVKWLNRLLVDMRVNGEQEVAEVAEGAEK